MEIQKIGLSLVIASLLLHTLLMRPASAQGPASKSLDVAVPVTIKYDVVYGQSSEPMHKADLYETKNTQPGKLRPGVLLIHGGAWTAGDKRNDTLHAQRIARQGMVVMVINYRLCPKHPHPAQIDDCFTAFKWFLDHAEELSVDKNLLGVWGYSAGGHLAALMATQPRDDYPRFKVCVAGGAPCDLTQLPDTSKMLVGFLGGTRKQFPQRYMDASPVTYVSPDDPPTFLFHGSRDWLVPPRSSDIMQKALNENGIECEYCKVIDKGHLMTFIDHDATEESFTFLKKHLCKHP